MVILYLGFSVYPEENLKQRRIPLKEDTALHLILYYRNFLQHIQGYILYASLLISFLNFFLFPKYIMIRGISASSHAKGPAKHSAAKPK